MHCPNTEFIDIFTVIFLCTLETHSVSTTGLFPGENVYVQVKTKIPNKSVELCVRINQINLTDSHRGDHGFNKYAFRRYLYHFHRFYSIKSFNWTACTSVVMQNLRPTLRYMNIHRDDMYYLGSIIKWFKSKIRVLSHIWHLKGSRWISFHITLSELVKVQSKSWLCYEAWIQWSSRCRTS